MSKDCFFKTPEYMEVKTIQGETVVVNTDNGEYHIFNAIGNLILELLQKGENMQEIVVTITREYDVDVNSAEEHVRKFTKELLNKKLSV